MVNDFCLKNNFYNPFFYERIVTPFGQLFGIELKYNISYYYNTRNSFLERERRVAAFKKKILFCYSLSHFFTAHRICCLISEDLNTLDVILKDRVMENFIVKMPFIWLGINNTEELSLMHKKRLLCSLSERHIILLNDFLSDSENSEIISTGLISAVKIKTCNPDILLECINCIHKKKNRLTPLIITEGINNMYVKGVTAMQLPLQYNIINSTLFSDAIPSNCSGHG